MNFLPAVGVLACLACSAWGVEVWETVAMPDGDMHQRTSGTWRAYGGATLEDVVAADGHKALRVKVAGKELGGLCITATPRGGMGNRVRLSIVYRLISGSPVSVFVGPNTFHQLAGRLSGRQWETATVELGIASDFHLVVHVVQQGPDAAFELADFRVEARPPEKPLTPARIGIVNLAMDGYCPSDPALALERFGNPLPRVERVGAGTAYQVTIPEGAVRGGRISQGLGVLPAGTRVSLECRCRSNEAAPIMLGLQSGSRVLAEQTTATMDWSPIGVRHLLQADGPVAWFARPASDRPTEFRLSDLHARVELPDPLSPGAVPMPSLLRPIRIAVGDAKSITITPPWPEFWRVLCHLEYNSRWGFRFPASHEAKLSEKSDALDLAWHFKDDPVAYSVHMKADRPDSVLVEARLLNESKKPVRKFVPGFCLQLAGAYSPTTFAYTIIPRAGKPFPLSMGRYFAPRPAMWANVGWVRADFTGSPDYAERVKQGPDFKPGGEQWIHETGDFPLSARRVPGRDAWIAWLWPNATGYFGNTQSPCMHMDPTVPDCPPGQTRSLFGRMLFFEGTWESLYKLAQRERQELAARSQLPAPNE